MTIKEIAALANVSITTVSKVLHRKDQNISDETRQRVLKIIRESNYVPYSSTRADDEQQTHIIGLLNGESLHPLVITSIIRSARKQGYSVIVCSYETAEEETINISALSANHVDGIVWFRSPFSSDQTEITVRSLPLPVIIVDYRNGLPDSVNFDYTGMAYQATQLLIQAKHQRLYCAANQSNLASGAFVRGFKNCLFDNKIPFDADHCFTLVDSVRQSRILVDGGIVCMNSETAMLVYRYAENYNLKIPRDLSVVCLKDADERLSLMPKVAGVVFPGSELGERIWNRLYCQMEKLEYKDDPTPAVCRVEANESIDIPKSLRNRKVIIIGAINQDTLLYVDGIPQNGEMKTVRKRVTLPGGKGLNQSLGASRLGAETYLIGKVGKDYEGSRLMDFLKANGIHTEGVITESNHSTGHAYIDVTRSGNSSIVVFDGANESLSPHDILSHEDLLDNASFCLIETEVPKDVCEYAASLAHQHHVRTLLKPCLTTELSDTLLQNTDFLIPNQHEAECLLPEISSIEEKAQWFLEHGVQTVIITLGESGCYCRSADFSSYFKAANVTTVDATGASDAFISALAVYLSRNYKLEAAIRYATCYAGLSVTRQGVPPSLVDQSTLELYMEGVDL